MGLGSYPDVSLSDAREKAYSARREVANGGDPIASRRAASSIPTLAEAAKSVHDARKAAWKNEKHGAQWLSSLEMHIFPKLGHRRVVTLASSDILGVLQPIWLTRPETARRIRQRLNAIFKWCSAMGHLSGPSPMDGVDAALPKQPSKDRHHAAMPIDDLPGFFRKLVERNNPPIAELALQFTILTAARTGEVIGARWSEMDLANSSWTIPADRMKMGREHSVPLTETALNLLSKLPRFAKSDWVFPGQRRARPLSNMAMLGVLKRKAPGLTVHGFRSTFRDWAAERTDYPAEVCEMALAHSIANKAEAAYRRGNLFEKRRELMRDWERFLLR